MWPHHKCPNQVQFVVIDEICAALELDSESSPSEADHSATEDSDSEAKQVMSLHLLRVPSVRKNYKVIGPHWIITPVQVTIASGVKIQFC